MLFQAAVVHLDMHKSSRFLYLVGSTNCFLVLFIVQYFSGSDVEVEQWTYKSFVRKEEKKLRRKGISAYLPFSTEFYRCPFHHFKPRGGLRVGLVQHVREVATRGRLGEDYFEGDLRDRGRHEALLRVLEPEEFVFSDSETEE